jgi:thiol-disulfide isomerase/thioredoxin
MRRVFSPGSALGMCLLLGLWIPGGAAVVGGGLHAQQLLLPGPIQTVSGEVILTESFQGRVVLINAWATWCGPCVREMPGFQRVLDEYEDKGFMVLGLSADTVGVEVVRTFVEKLGIRYPITIVPQYPLVLLAPQVKGLPTSFLLNQEGMIVKTVEGVYSEEALRADLEELLKGRFKPGEGET